MSFEIELDKLNLCTKVIKADGILTSFISKKVFSFCVIYPLFHSFLSRNIGLCLAVSLSIISNSSLSLSLSHSLFFVLTSSHSCSYKHSCLFSSLSIHLSFSPFLIQTKNYIKTQPVSLFLTYTVSTLIFSFSLTDSHIHTHTHSHTLTHIFYLSPSLILSPSLTLTTHSPN